MKRTFRGRRAVLAIMLLAGALAVPVLVTGSGPDDVAPPFHTADRCMACHNQLVAPDGRDVSIGFDWRSSMMGNSGRDPYWMAAVRRETLDHPSATDAIEDKCTVCHLPMARTLSVGSGGQGRAFENFPVIGPGGPHVPLAQDGVSCTVCHQIQDENLGTRAGFTGGYVIDVTTPSAQRTAYGPFEVDRGRGRVMTSATGFDPQEGSHIQSSEFCANCHTLFTHALDDEGNEVGELPEQTPYLEWAHSGYAGNTGCQDCHMPVVEGEVSVTSVLANPRTEVNRHVFRGGNFLMPRILNKHRADLGVTALPQELEATARASEENLRTGSASLALPRFDVLDGRVAFDVSVTNLTGHKLPSAYPSRRAWLHVTIEDGDGRVLLESGEFDATGMIRGNDNDLDPGRYEPHYDKITSSDEVQIYEDIMVDYRGSVTTGLLRGVRYVKDNRILPRGFDKTSASSDVAVHGHAAEDGDFVGGSDVVRYSAAVGGAAPPFRVVAELWYQPIGYRWAENLREYDTVESARFLSFFEGVASTSSALLARAEATVR